MTGHAAENGLRESWGWRDSRTGQRVSVTSTPTRESAERQLEEWRARDRRGKRPDLHDLMPHLEVYRIFPPGHHPRCTGQHETIMGETACVLPPGGDHA